MDTKKPVSITKGSIVKASLDLHLSLANIKRGCRGVVIDDMGDNLRIEFEGGSNFVIIPPSFVDLCLDTPQQPVAVPPVGKGQEAMTPDEVRVQIIKDAFDLSQPIAPAATQLNSMVVELATLRQQLAAANERARGLTEALEDIKPLVSAIELSLCYFPDSPRRKDFETLSEYDTELEKYLTMNTVVNELAKYNRLAAREPAASEGQGE